MQLLKGKSQRKYTTKDGREFVVRRALPGDLEVLLRNFQRVADEEIYVATKKVSKAQKNRILATMKNPRNLSIVADFEKGVGIVGSLTLVPQREVKR